MKSDEKSTSSDVSKGSAYSNSSGNTKKKEQIDGKPLPLKPGQQRLDSTPPPLKPGQQRLDSTPPPLKPGQQRLDSTPPPLEPGRKILREDDKNE